MIEYFRARVMGVLKESPGLSDPENADVLVATMNGLTDEAWALGVLIWRVTTDIQSSDVGYMNPNPS